jgi:hypothetical protein
MGEETRIILKYIASTYEDNTMKCTESCLIIGNRGARGRVIKGD